MKVNKAIKFTKNWFSKYILLFVVIIAFFFSFYWQRKVFLSPYVFSDDARQVIYYFYQVKDKSFFQHDLLTDYAKHYEVWGFNFFYSLLSYIFDPLLISKIIGVFSLAISAIVIYKIGKLLNGKLFGFTAFLLFLKTSHFLISLTGGFPRAFMTPFFLLFLYFLIKRKFILSSLFVVGLGFLYPAGFALSLAILILFLGLHFVKLKKNQKSKLLISACLILFVLGCYFLKFLALSDNKFGRLADREYIKNKIEFTSKGRFEVYPVPSLLKEVKILFNELIFVQITRFFHLPKYLIFFLLIFFFGTFLIKRPIFLAVFILSCLFYKLADIFLVRLFLPSRYIQYSFRIVLIFLDAEIIYFFIKLFRKKTKIGDLITFIIILGLFYKVCLVSEPVFEDKRAERKLFIFLKSLPKQSLIAAHPFVADNIPLLAQRKVFINYELSHPLYQNYWKEIKERTDSLFQAYYAETEEEVINFCQENKINYFLVDLRYLNSNFLAKNEFYFEPFNSTMKPLLSKNHILTRIKEDKKIFSWENFYVLNCDNLR